MSHLVNVTGSLDTLGDVVTIEGTVALAPIELGAAHFEPIGPASFSVTLTNTGAGIVADGEVRATLRTSCVRCLREFDLEVEGTVEGFYVHPGDEDTMPEEAEPEPIRDGRIDLEPAIVQALVVDLPFAPLHDPACAGICPRCGEDRNDGACTCPDDSGTHPFAELGALLPRDEE